MMTGRSFKLVPVFPVGDDGDSWSFDESFRDPDDGGDMSRYTHMLVEDHVLNADSAISHPSDGLSKDGGHVYSDVILENLGNISDRTIEALRYVIPSDKDLDMECRRLLHGLLSIYAPPLDSEDTK